MNTSSNFSAIKKDTELTKQLANFRQEEFSGRLEVKSHAQIVWRLYLYLGRLVWADGGQHPNRSWRRHLAKYYPKVNKSQLSIQDTEQWECQNYQIINICLQEQKIKPQQVNALIKSKIQEILFDILQQETYQQLEYSREPAKNSPALALMLKRPAATINSEQALEEAQIYWSEWIKQGLGFWSPNTAPSIINSDSLKKAVPEKTYQNLVKLLDGKRSLRDLAFLMGQDTLKVTLFLASYLHQGVLSLVNVKDIAPLIGSTKINTGSPQQQEKINKNKGLIISIDDQPEIGKLMGAVLRKAGYQFISIQDNLNAVSRIISYQPSLIFLDINMPIINGYEVCTQIRRVPEFKKIPIIMLTGADGPIDKVRAKLAGASGFISKPVEVSQILDTIEKFVVVSENENS